MNESRIHDCAGAIAQVIIKKPEGYIQFCKDNARAILFELEPESELIEVIKGLRRGSCFCEAGIDSPIMQGRHTEACIKAQAAIAKAEGRS